MKFIKGAKKKKKFIKGAKKIKKVMKGVRTWRSILRAQTFLWPLTPPAPPGFRMDQPLSKGLV